MKKGLHFYLKNKKCCKLICIFILLLLIFTPVVTANAKWVKVGKKHYRYTTNTSGTKFYKNKWAKIKGKYYYFNKKGYRQTGWLNYKGKKYYLNKKGVRVTGFKKIKGKKYYFSKKGVMISGWIKSGGDYYYTNEKGVVQTGLQLIHSKVYYFTENGIRVSGAHIVLGNLSYYFSNNGSLQYTGTKQEQAAKYINIQRMLKGYKPLSYYVTGNLAKASELRAKELAQLSSHIRPDGSSYSTVLINEYPVANYWSGECASWGKSKAGDVVAANWMSNSNSSVLLKEKANGMSIGIYVDEKGKEYWVALIVQTQ